MATTISATAITIGSDQALTEAGSTNNLNAGFPTDVEALGNSGTGTVTPNLDNEILKTLTINGSFTLGEPGKTGGCLILCTNDATGGYTITTTGYEIIGGGTYIGTANAKNFLKIIKEGSNSYLEWNSIA